MTPLKAAAWLWLLTSIANYISIPLMALLVQISGLEPKELRFHSGPALFSFQALGMRWSFGLFSVAGSVDSRVSDGSDEPLEPEQEPDYARLSFPRRLFYLSIPILVRMLFVLALLPVSRGVAEIASGFEQMTNLLAAPRRVLAFFKLLETEGPSVALGVLSAKGVALSLLPLPLLQGFFLLREIVLTLLKRPSRTIQMSPWLAVPVLLALWVGWSIALLVAFLSMR